MALEITLNYTDPNTDLSAKQPFTIFPGEVNTTSTSLAMVGQGTMNYGKYIMNDLLHILENFCSTTAPEAGTRGQLWFDTTENTLKVYTYDAGASTKTWNAVGGVHISTSAPSNKDTLWYDISNVDPTQWQLKIFNPSIAVNAWVSVASRYVQRTGDSMSGDLTFTVSDKGLVGTLSGFTNRITPITTRGPAIIGGHHATIVINSASASATGSEFVVGTGTSLTSATDSAGRLMTISDAGVVTIHKNSLSMTGRKIINLADGTIASDAVTYGQLQTAANALQASLTSLSTTVAGHTVTLNNKVSKTGDTMSGALVINNTLYTGSLLTAAGGVSVTGGALAVTNSASIGIDLTVGGTLSVTGVTTLGSNLTVGGQVQLNSTLVANGATQLKSTVAITGAATLSSSISVAGNAVISGNTTMTGIALMNQPISSITNGRHLTTKEYVDGKIAAIPQAPVPTGIWAGVTTIENIAITYADATAYPPGTTVAFIYQWTYTYGTGNGSATATASQRRVAVRTVNAGWQEAGNLT